MSTRDTWLRPCDSGSPLERRLSSVTKADGSPADYFVSFTQQAPYAFTHGQAYPHPNWTGRLTVPNTNDVGLVVLDEPVMDIAPAQIAPLGLIDDLLTQRGTQSLRMVAVGFGLQESWPPQSNKPQRDWDMARWWGEQRLLQASSAYTRGYNIQLTNNPGLGNGSGVRAPATPAVRFSTRRRATLWASSLSVWLLTARATTTPIGWTSPTLRTSSTRCSPNRSSTSGPTLIEATAR